MKKSILLIALMLATAISMQAADREFYCQLSGKNLTFYYNVRTATSYITDWQTDELKNSVNYVAFDVSMREYEPESMKDWFKGFTALQRVTGMENLNTSKTKDLSYMFANCNSLTSLDVSTLDLSSAENVRNMFYYCNNMTTLYSNKDWPSTLNGAQLFANCSSLVGANGTAYESTKFGIERACVDRTEKEGYFTPLKHLYSAYANDTLTFYYDGEWDKRAKVDFYAPAALRFKTICDDVKVVVVDKSVKDYKANSLAYLFCGHNFSGAYYYLKNAKKFIGLENLNTDNVLTMSSMFWGCKSIDTLDVSGFNTENVTSIGSMFRDCESLKVLNISSFALPKVTDIRMAFYDCKALKTIYCNYDWNSLTTLTQSANTFSNCNALEGAHGTAYSSEHKDKEYARPDKSGTPGYFTSVIEMIDSEKAVIDIYKGYIATIKNYIGMFTFEGVTKFVKDLGDRISTLEDILSITGSDMSTYKTMKNGRNLAETYYNTSREDYINLVIEATKRDINNLGETDDSEASQKILTDAQTACDTIGKVWVGYQTVIDNVKDVWDLSEFIYEEAKEDVITQRLNEAKAVLNDTITEMQALYAFANSFLEDKSMLAPLQTAIETAQAVYNTAGVQRPEIQEATKKAHEAFVTAVEALMDKAKKEMKAELDQMDVKDCDKCHNIIADAKDEVDALTWDYSKNVKVNTDALYGDGQSIYSKAQQQISLATGIESVQNSEVRIQKVVRDGQLLIIRDGKMYNAQGAEVR